MEKQIQKKNKKWVPIREASNQATVLVHYLFVQSPVKGLTFFNNSTQNKTLMMIKMTMNKNKNNTITTSNNKNNINITARLIRTKYKAM